MRFVHLWSLFLFVLKHRMRPEIARLLTPHIYKELENHPSVLEYENIKVHVFVCSPAVPPACKDFFKNFTTLDFQMHLKSQI